MWLCSTACPGTSSTCSTCSIVVCCIHICWGQSFFLQVWWRHVGTYTSVSMYVRKRENKNEAGHHPTRLATPFLHLLDDFRLVLIPLHKREIINFDLTEEYSPAMSCWTILEKPGNSIADHVPLRECQLSVLLWKSRRLIFGNAPSLP